MVHKGPKVLDFFFGDYRGRYAQIDKNTDQGRKPVIRPTNSVRTKVFPYPLEEKNIIRHNGMMVLVPTPDVEGLTEKEYEKTIFARIERTQDEELANLKEKRISLKKERNKWKNKYYDEIEEEPESDKGNSRGSVSRYQCTYCSEVSSKSNWKSDDHNNEDKCPECGEGSFDNAEEVN